MRPLALLILAAALAGCATPEPGGVVTAPLVAGAALPAPECPTECAREWWNATIEAPGAFEMELPVPAVWPHASEHVIPTPSPWTFPRVTEGNATASLVTLQRGSYVEVRGDGLVHIEMSARFVAPAGVAAEQFLRARWDLATARAEALPFEAPDDVDVRITYEALSALCERRALLERDGATLRGTDAARCA